MNVDKPLISVITVSYNAVRTIEETIISVLNQSYPFIEYIIIDGGSTDGTVDVIKEYEDRITYWASKPDKGIYDAMNKGVLMSHGDFLFFLGADDVIIADISKIACTFNMEKIYYGSIIQRTDGKIIRSRYNQYSIVRKNVPHQAIFYPKIVFKYFEYTLKYKLYADWFLNIQCLSIKIPCQYIDCSIVLYNDCGSSGIQHDNLFLNDLGCLIRQNLNSSSYIYWRLISLVRNVRGLLGSNFI